MKNIFKCKKNNFKITDAYFTIEAAFLIPIVLCLFAFIIYLAFFMYDRCLLTQDSYQAALLESERKDGDEKEDRREFLPDKTRYFMLSGLNFDGEKGEKEYTTRASASVHTLFDHRRIGVDTFEWNLVGESTARISDPPAAFRTYRRTVRVTAEIVRHIKDEGKEEGN